IGQRRKTLERLVLPKLGGLAVTDVKRLTVRPLLNSIAEQRGERAADEALFCINLVLKFHEDDDDTEAFRAPSLGRLRRTTPKSRMRKRSVSDDEVAALWKACDDAGYPYGRYIQFMTLTATRRCEASDMTRGEVRDGNWTIPG